MSCHHRDCVVAIRSSSCICCHTLAVTPAQEAPHRRHSCFVIRFSSCCSRLAMFFIKSSSCHHRRTLFVILLSPGHRHRTFVAKKFIQFSCCRRHSTFVVQSIYMLAFHPLYMCYRQSIVIIPPSSLHCNCLVVIYRRHSIIMSWSSIGWI